MRLFPGLVILLALAGCSVPQSRKEFRNWLKEDHSFFTKKEFTLENTSLKTMEARLVKFGNKCLNLETYVTRHGTFGSSTRKNATYKPSLERADGRVSLYLQQLYNGAYLGKVPEDGPYMFLAEATKGKREGQIHAVVHYATVQFGNIGEDAVGWMKGESEFCPELN